MDGAANQIHLHGGVEHQHGHIPSLDCTNHMNTCTTHQAITYLAT